MDVSLAILADYANVTREGKLNVLGIFDTIHARQFPCKHVHMHLVMQFSAALTEQAKTRDLAVVLIDPDGRQLMRCEGKVQLRTQQGGAGLRCTQILQLLNTTFTGPGDHEIHIMLDGQRADTVPLRVAATGQCG